MEACFVFQIGYLKISDYGAVEGILLLKLISNCNKDNLGTTHDEVSEEGSSRLQHKR